MDTIRTILFLIMAAIAAVATWFALGFAYEIGRDFWNDFIRPTFEFFRRT